MPHRTTLPRAAAFALAPALAALLSAACGGGDTGPAPIIPTRLTFAAQPDSGLVGDTLALGTTAVDASGRAATSASIAYTYQSSDTTVVSVGTGGLVRYVGPGTATVTATATGVPGGGSALTLATGPIVSFRRPARVRALPSRVDATPGTYVSLSAAVYDSGGNAISFPLDYTSDNTAVARVSPGALVAGSAGTAQVTVRANFRGRGVSTTLPVAVAATSQGPFPIQLVQIGAANPAYAQVFQRAATFWQGVITAALPVANLDVNGDSVCGDGEPVIKTSTTGVAIFFRVDSIDGPGNILGAAGPCVLRQDATAQQRGLPALGTMIFDSADFGRLVQAGTAYDVIRHEMGHVLGIGTLWNVDGVRTYLAGAGSADPQYLGPNGEAASAVLGFTRDGAAVPVENVGDDGTANSHWRSSTYYSELMTGYLKNTATHPASRLTILSLADLGYQVNAAASEPLIPTSPAALRASRAAVVGAAAAAPFDVALPPLFALTPNGKLRRLRDPLPIEARLRLR